MEEPGFREDEVSPRCNLFVRDSNENLRERVYCSESFSFRDIWRYQSEIWLKI